jgi:hypothetical protein
MTFETPEAVPHRPAPIPSGRVTVGGTEYMPDAKGALVPLGLIKPQHLLEDEVVRKIMGFAVALSDQVGRFKAHTFDDIGAFEALLAQEYGAAVGGPKGNKTLMTHDALCKVTVQVADNVVFGPELQVAKSLVDECLNEWAEGARAELRAIVTRAFNTDREGQINRAALYMLLRLDIADARWQRAMAAIRDAMRVVGSKTYVRVYRRDRPDAAWEPVAIDLAKA